MGSVIVAFFLSVAIVISAWQFMPRYASIPDGQALTSEAGKPARPGVIVTNQRSGAVEHCYYSNDNYICTPIRVPAN
jgi:hypothetical protein